MANLQSLQQLTDAGVALVGLDVLGLDTATPTGRWTLHNMMSQAQYHSDQMGETWRMTHARRRREGKHHSGARPLGYEFDKTVAGGMRPKDGEAEKIREAFERYCRGESQAAITKELDFTNATVLSRVLQSPTCAGLMGKPGKPETWEQGAWEPLVSVETFERAQDRRKAKGSHKGRPKGSGTLLLTGILVCGRCGAPCHAGSPKGYKCTAAGKCGMWHVDIGVADQTVMDEFGKHGIDHLMQLAEEHNRRRATSATADIQKKIAKVDGKIARLVRRAADTDSEAFIAAFGKETTRLEAERNALETERAMVKTDERDAEQSIPALVRTALERHGYDAAVQEIATAWLEATQQERRRMLAAAIERVETVERIKGHRGVRVIWRKSA